MNTPSQAQQLAEEARAAFQAGRYAEAASLFERAHALSVQAGDALAAAEMANNLSVARLQAGDAAGALAVVQGTDQVFEQTGDTVKQAMALGNQAAAQEALGQLETALSLYQQSADLLKPHKDQAETRAFVLKSISSLQVRTGRQLEALASMNAALDQQKKLSLREKLLQKLLGIPFKQIK